MAGSNRKPMDEAELEAWLAETLELPRDVPGRLLNTHTQSVLAMRDRVRETLVPIPPSQKFVRELGQTLAQQMSQRQQTLRQRYRRALWFAVAAAGSMASLVGLIVYLFYQKQHPRSL